MQKWLRDLSKLPQVVDRNGFESVHKTYDYLRQVGYYPRFSTISAGVNEPESVVDGEKYLVFCANNYLSLSENSAVKHAAMDAIEKYGTGPGGSRVIAGNIDIIEELEARIATLTGTEACLTFPTGYMANITVFQAVMDPFLGRLPYRKGSGAIFLDEYNHGSVFDGIRLSSAQVITYKHDDLDDLNHKLGLSPSINKLIVTEGAFSLEGSILDLPRYLEVAKKHRAKIMIDDAHGIGIIGDKGGGVGRYHDCADQIDILMGCMDKAMGGTGGYLCGKKPLIDYLRLAARSSLLSSAIPCGMAGGMIESINQIESGDDIREDISAKAQYLRESFENMGFRILGRDNIPSVPLFIGNDELSVTFSEELLKLRVMLPPVRWPATPPGKSRFRIIVMASHKQRHLDRLLESCETVGKKLGCIA